VAIILLDGLGLYEVVRERDIQIICGSVIDQTVGCIGLHLVRCSGTNP